MREGLIPKHGKSKDLPCSLHKLSFLKASPLSVGVSILII
ncbi:hypothetical protein ES703_66617 [subsurface metagenome]